MKTFCLGFLVFCFLISLTACSSPHKMGYMMPESPSTAPGEAYAAEAFTFRKEQPDRRNAKPWQFYYKTCETNGDQSFYSKTSYNCSGPYY